MSGSIIERLRGRQFVLVENVDGHVVGATVMSFSQNEPLTGHYTGPNVLVGQVLVNASTAGTHMLYQALTSEGALVAGAADVQLAEQGRQMVLDWQWLTGERSGGQSKWRRRDQPL